MKNKGSRFLAVFMALFVMFTVLPEPIQAEAASVKVWSGKADTSWYKPGKESYDIKNAEQLAGLAKIVNEGTDLAGVVFNLTSDIVLNDTKGWMDWIDDPPKNVWTPIGYSTGSNLGHRPFNGIFNGNGHSITGMYVYSGRTAGLFGYLYCAGVSSVMISKSCIIADNDKDAYAGGIAGIAEGSVINQCECDANVYAVGNWDGYTGRHTGYAGGIVGAVTIENVSAALAGGLFILGGYLVNPALFNDGNGGIIKVSGIMNCVSWGEVHAAGYWPPEAGGIAGYIHTASVSNCLALSAVFIKNDTMTIVSYIGRVVGHTFRCKFTDTYYFTDGKDSVKGVGYRDTGEFADTTVGLSADEIMSKKFYGKLGDCYNYKAGDRPYLKVMKNKATYDESAASSTSSSSSSSNKPGKPSGLSASKKSGKLTLSWGKVKNAEKYEVYYSDDGGETYIKLGSTSKTKLTTSKLDIKNYSYKIKVRAYRTVDGKKVYGSFSDVITV